jgi:hypothetical protein
MLQACFLPGYIAARVFRTRGTIPILVIAFAVSMIINHFIVLILSVAGIQYSAIWYVLFVLEIAWILRSRDRKPVYSTGDAGVPVGISTGDSQLRQRIYPAADYAAAFTVLAFVVYAIMDMGSIFTTWDAVGSWNPWGVMWSMGAVPKIWGTYPQLIPTAYALTYLFLGTTKIQFFAKALAPIFPIMTLLTMLDLGRTKRSLGILLGTTICGFLLYFVNATLNENLLLSGYADVPVSFFGMLVFWCLFRAENQAKDSRKRYLYLGAVASIGASLTKQTGLYFAAFYPLLAYLIVLQPAGISLRDSWKLLLRLSCLMAFLVVPWYAYRAALILSGSSTDNMEELVVGLHGTRTFAQRIEYGIDLLTKQLGGSFFLSLIAFLNVVGIRIRAYRWILFLVTLPFTLIWAMAFSYSLRNIAIVVPLFALGAGVGLEQLIVIVRSFGPGWYLSPTRPGHPRWGWAIGVAVVVVIALSFVFTPARMLKNQLTLQREIGDRELGRFLYDYHRDHPIKGKIASHYRILPLLPGFEEFAIGLKMQDYKMYESMCADASIRYFLIPTWANPFYDQKIVTDVRHRLEDNRFTSLLEANGWLYVSKTTPQEQESNRRLAEAEKLVAKSEFERAIEVLSGTDMELMDAPGRGYYLYAFSLQYSPKRDNPESRDQAAALYEKALHGQFNEFWIRYNRGCLYSTMNRRAEAIVELQRASELDPGFEDARKKLAKLKKHSRT